MTVKRASAIRTSNDSTNLNLDTKRIKVGAFDTTQVYSSDDRLDNELEEAKVVYEIPNKADE
jgi:hypothetical protein